MKTTIDIPEDLFLKAKALAVERGTTLKEIMVQALSLFTQARPKQDVRKHKAAFRRLLKEMKAPDSQLVIPLKRQDIYDR